MVAFEVKLRDGSSEQIRDADGYQPEGQLTTFFRFGTGREVIDAWSTRVASVRTSEIVAVRRVPTSPGAAGSKDMVAA